MNWAAVSAVSPDLLMTLNSVPASQAGGVVLTAPNWSGSTLSDEERGPGGVGNLDASRG